MIHVIVSVYDGKANVYGSPLCFPNTAVACRGFEDVVNDPQSMISKHPADFVLFQIATYDDNTGKFEAVEPHMNLGVALGYKKGGPQEVVR